MSCFSRRCSFRGSLLLLDDLVEAVEALVPAAAISLNPVGDVVEPPRAEIAMPRPAALLGGDELSFLQDPDVLLETGQRHLTGSRELADRGATATEPLEDCSASRVGQRGHRSIQVRILNH